MRRPRAALTRLVRSIDGEFLVHLDLHETTDTDETDFRPADSAIYGHPLPEDASGEKGGSDA